VRGTGSSRSQGVAVSGAGVVIEEGDHPEAADRRSNRIQDASGVAAGTDADQ
jgi:hypothetical protein